MLIRAGCPLTCLRRYALFLILFHSISDFRTPRRERHHPAMRSFALSDPTICLSHSPPSPLVHADISSNPSRTRCSFYPHTRGCRHPRFLLFFRSHRRCNAILYISFSRICITFSKIRRSPRSPSLTVKIHSYLVPLLSISLACPARELSATFRTLAVSVVKLT